MTVLTHWKTVQGLHYVRHRARFEAFLAACEQTGISTGGDDEKLFLRDCESPEKQVVGLCQRDTVLCRDDAVS